MNLSRVRQLGLALFKPNGRYGADFVGGGESFSGEDDWRRTEHDTSYTGHYCGWVGFAFEGNKNKIHRLRPLVHRERRVPPPARGLGFISATASTVAENTCTQATRKGIFNLYWLRGSTHPHVNRSELWLRSVEESVDPQRSLRFAPGILKSG